jgi:2-oxoglutarate ferredoxin oxidoreductase subunit alpha
MSLSSISIAITGSGGSGVMTAGKILLDAVAQSGYYGLMARSLGPQVRGGEAAAFLRFADEPIQNSGDYFQVIIALDWVSVERFRGELGIRETTIVIYDPEHGNVPNFIAEKNPRTIPMPLKAMAKQAKGGRVNMLAVGVIARLVRLDIDVVRAVMQKIFDQKNSAVIEKSIDCARLGYEEADKIEFKHIFRIEARKPKKIWSITGNEATGLGAMQAGVRFVAAYPITPATGILEWMAPNLVKTGGTLVQAEDELAAINMIVGASYGGVPALTATSGPGLALMMEGFGLAIAAEIPCVVVDVQRGGPSTGIPTKTEQSDLNIALYGMHGDAPHLVLAASSATDCMFTASWATYLAEKLQVPAIMLSDQFIGQARVIVDAPERPPFVAKRKLATNIKGDYKRYDVTDDYVSPMAIVGEKGGTHNADGLEHDEYGTPSTMAHNHEVQLNKRQQKLENNDYGDYWATTQGTGKTAIITFGACVGPIVEALNNLDMSDKVKLIALRLISPAQPEKMEKELEGIERVLVIEQNHSAMLYKYLKANYDCMPDDFRSFARPGPLPFKAEFVKHIIEGWG